MEIIVSYLAWGQHILTTLAVTGISGYCFYKLIAVWYDHTQKPYWERRPFSKSIIPTMLIAGVFFLFGFSVPQQQTESSYDKKCHTLSYANRC